MSLIKDLFKEIRPYQWYKNLVIFLPIVFVGKLFVIQDLLKVVLGFIALCLISSGNYVINDLIDVKADRLHPIKRNRPIASGRLSKSCGICLGCFAFVGGALIGFSFGGLFFYSCLALIIIGLLYSVWLKGEPFLDIILIGLKFVIRAISGAFIINVEISPWLILGIFFFALFLASTKRYGDIVLLEKEAKQHKKVLGFYNKTLALSFMNISTSILIVFYSLYIFMGQKNELIYTLPSAVYCIFRYYFLSLSNPAKASAVEKALFDKKLLIGMVITGLILLVVLYG